MVDVEKHESFVSRDEYFPPILDPKLSSTVFFIGIKFVNDVIVLIDKEEALTLMSECMRKKEFVIFGFFRMGRGKNKLRKFFFFSILLHFQTIYGLLLGTVNFHGFFLLTNLLFQAVETFLIFREEKMSTKSIILLMKLVNLQYYFD